MTAYTEAVARQVARAVDEGSVAIEVTSDGVRARDDLHVPEPPPAAPARPAPPSSLDVLVAAAARSTSKRTQTLGVKLNDLAGVLRQRLADERAAAERTDAEKAEQAKVRAEVERLEKQLREARAKLSGGRVTEGAKKSRKPYTISDEERQRRSERMKARAAARRAAAS